MKSSEKLLNRNENIKYPQQQSQFIGQNGNYVQQYAYQEGHTYQTSGKLHRSSQQLQMSIDDLLLMKTERLCKDFLFLILRKYTFFIKMKTLQIEDINNQKVKYLTFLQPNEQSQQINNEQTLKLQCQNQERIDQLLSQNESLKQEVEEKNRTFEKQTRKHEEQMKKIEQMRYDYMKDIRHLREFIYQKDNKTNNNDYIDVRFFEASQDLDEKTQAIINEKMSSMALQFNSRFNILQKTNDAYFKQITLFDLLCKDGNMLIGLHEMNANDMIRKLFIVEKNAQVVWNEIEKHYGYGYFNKIIEKQFGITPDVLDKIAKDFTEQLSIVKNDASIKINRVSQQGQVEVIKLAKELRDKNAIMSNKRQEQIQEIDHIRDELKFTIQKEHQKLVTELENQYQEKISLFNKKIFMLENGFKGGKAIEKEEWKKFYDKEIETLREQNVRLIKNDQENQYTLKKLQIENQTLKHQFEEVNMELEQLQNDYQARKKQISFYESECQNLRLTFQDQVKYIEALEKEADRINSSLKRVQTHYPDVLVVFNNPLQTLDKLKKKTANDLATQVVKGLTKILYEQKHDQYILTEIYDITKELNFKVIDDIVIEIPKCEQIIQVQPEILDQDIQTQIFTEYATAFIQTELEMPQLYYIEEKASQLEETQHKNEQLEQKIQNLANELKSRKYTKKQTQKSKSLLKAESNKDLVSSSSSKNILLKSRDNTLHSLCEESLSEEIDLNQDDDNLLNIEIQQDSIQEQKKDFAFEKRKKIKKKKSKQPQIVKQIQVYKIVPYNVPHLEKLLNRINWQTQACEKEPKSKVTPIERKINYVKPSRQRSQSPQSVNPYQEVEFYHNSKTLIKRVNELQKATDYTQQALDCNKHNSKNPSICSIQSITNMKDQPIYSKKTVAVSQKNKGCSSNNSLRREVQLQTQEYNLDNTNLNVSGFQIQASRTNSQFYDQNKASYLDQSMKDKSNLKQIFSNISKDSPYTTRPKTQEGYYKTVDGSYFQTRKLSREKQIDSTTLDCLQSIGKGRGKNNIRIRNYL